jgi:folate-dependent phosphoribosylglycinamide formyltransferase PurN
MLRVAVLCSRRAPGLVPFLEHDRWRGSRYEVVCCLTSSEAFDEDADVERRGVPCIPHLIRPFCRERGVGLSDLEVRAEYDAVTLGLLAPFRPDLIVLDGYLLLLTEVFLEAYANRTVNIHHGDLSLRSGGGAPKYPGLRAVRDALLAGEIETRASAHIVTPQLDDGPVILRSWSFPVSPVVQWARQHEATDILKACAWAHQEWMLRSAWQPMLTSTIELAAHTLAGDRGHLDLRRAGEWQLTEGGTLLPGAGTVTSGFEIDDYRSDDVGDLRTAWTGWSFRELAS